jgi:hypothetical protein
VQVQEILAGGSSQKGEIILPELSTFYALLSDLIFSSLSRRVAKRESQIELPNRIAQFLLVAGVAALRHPKLI